MMRRAPKYTQAFTDRHGHPRFYFRKRGHPRVALPGLPWSPEFMARYSALVSIKPTVPPPSVGRVVPRSIKALAIHYYDAASYRALKSNTQGVYKSIIERFCREIDPAVGRPFGDMSAVTLKSRHIEMLMEARKDMPDSANGLRRVLREMMKVARKLEWRDDDPTQGVGKIKSKNKTGYHSWTDAEIAQFEERHPIGSKARLAMALGLYSGQARQDVILMGEQHVSGGALNWIRKKTEAKTGFELTIPVHPELRRIIDATPSGHLTFLVTERGAPFTPQAFNNWFRQCANEAGLPHVTFHGLRKAAATRLADMGCDPIEIAAVTGHASLKEVQRYTETRDRKRAARRAMDKLIAGT